MKDRDDNLVQSVDRAITLLEALAEGENGYGITELSNVTGLHKTTVFRLLNTLMSRGYVEKDLKSDKYRLGIRLLLLGSAILDRMDLRNTARPYIKELSDDTKEVVHLAILDEGEAVYIDKVESPDHSIRIYSQIGKRSPLHCTALGKVLLSGLSDSEVEKIIKAKGLKKYTEKTITDFQQLKEEIALTRERGYGFDEIEHEEGIRCVAAPIYDRRGKIVAAISISGPIIYITQERMAELTEKITRTAKAISCQLGYLE
ncbi:MAG: IclR family transcriptional regulator [Clostridiales bacterium]|nr:IclR family transcriptional regulator [Eubacteriales bacterium]MDH7567163.1 IclR family transcriptional regulator [Clostridiales bacterium]